MRVSPGTVLGAMGPLKSSNRSEGGAAVLRFPKGMGLQCYPPASLPPHGKRMKAVAGDFHVSQELLPLPLSQGKALLFMILKQQQPHHDFLCPRRFPFLAFRWTPPLSQSLAFASALPVGRRVRGEVIAGGYLFPRFLFRRAPLGLLRALCPAPFAPAAGRAVCSGDSSSSGLPPALWLPSLVCALLSSSGKRHSKMQEM